MSVKLVVSGAYGASFVAVLLFSGFSQANEQWAQQQIQQIISAHPGCTQTPVYNRGAANDSARRGYTQGFMYTLARSLCRDSSDPIRMHTVQGRRNANREALVHLGLSYGSTEEETLVNTATVLFTLGFWESSGNHTQSIDRSAGAASSQPINAEAGLFQASLSGVANRAEWGDSIRELMVQYQQDPSKCMRDIFSQGVTVDSRASSGSAGNAGFQFQELMRNCPAFSVEAAMIMIRNNRQHFGPINVRDITQRSGEHLNQCRPMLTQIAASVQRESRFCEGLGMHSGQGSSGGAGSGTHLRTN